MDKIKIIQGDITQTAVDAIVNAANSSLMGGGGVDGAIHREGGSAIVEECRKIVARQGGCKTGEAVITTAGNLPAKYVIHTVGPIWNEHPSPVKPHCDAALSEGNNADLLKNCYVNALKLAVENGCKTIAFPNISTGVYGYPKDKAAIVSMQAVKAFLANNSSIEQVVFVCFDQENFHLLTGQL